MSIPVWPASLQQRMNASGFQRSYRDITIRTNMDAGPAKVRRRYTNAPIDISGNIWVNRDEYATLDRFFKNDLRNGVSKFYFIDPITGLREKCRFFPATYQVRAINSVLFEVKMALEVVPE